MKLKFCPKCGMKIDNESYNFCPECGFALAKEERLLKTLIEKNQKQQEEDRYSEFKKSVIAVAEAYFAMSKEEREAMIEYTQNKCDEAIEEAEALQNKKYRS